MTDEQRDELLLSLAKGLNNLQCSFNDFRVEIKTELNTKIDSVKKKIDSVEQKLNAKIDSVEQKLNAKIDSVEQKLNAKIDSVEQKLNDKIDNVQISFNQKLEEVAKNSREEIKQAIDFNNKGIIEMFKDIWQSNKVFNKRLNQHDIEIKKLKAKFN